MKIDLEQLRALMRSMTEHDVHELELEQGEERVVLRRGGVYTSPGLVAAPVAAPVAVHAAPAAASADAAATPATSADGPDVAFVTCPFVGTFYRQPSPDAEPFVSPGDDVKAGKTLCIVEAMKLMNEIEAEFACTILDVLVENGKPVEYGDKLFRVRKR
jgi:acetyl-CoA carboxylase biotin carboxyl carrier protein